ncbi:beta-lactamase-like protein [Podospora aff. communis PSN243]|uniref:Beta-lactamase-like protein n=1 Tax=Podospora aff. communis PSN243 TaxID=3040156 RepID=A0AAV9GUF9_9PEZI|nr:beta-lactamase-like protein [Podospora aff. communis PSN243]
MSVYVKLSALDAGHLTLPERLFITDADPTLTSTVPSLSFLIQHPSSPANRPSATHTNILFDLGIKRDLNSYPPAQRAHNAQRQPIITTLDSADSLRAGGLDPTAIDLVILSHIHWDHIGTPSDFSQSTFLVGSGTLNMLRHGAGPLYPAELFNADELPALRTVELPPSTNPIPHTQSHTPLPANSQAVLPSNSTKWEWKSLPGSHTLRAIDIFSDESIYIIDAPGHLPGHINLLARIAEKKYVYLGGDCCHDARIWTGERGIAMYPDGKGGIRSVHVDTDAARGTLEGVREWVAGRRAEGCGVEMVLAHDGGWREGNRGRFWPGCL